MTISRYLPSPEALNLFTGVMSAVAINVLTSVVLGGVDSSRIARVIWCGSLMFVGAIGAGIIAVLLTRARDEALNGIPISISSLEKRALIQNSINEMGRAIPLMTYFSLACFAASGAAAVLA